VHKVGGQAGLVELSDRKTIEFGAQNQYKRLWETNWELKFGGRPGLLREDAPYEQSAGKLIGLDWRASTWQRRLLISITNEHRDRVARITTKFNKRIQL